MLTNETLATIKQRRSIRSYKDQQIKEEELQAVLEAGMHAPNAGGQAWHFTVVQNKELLKRLNTAAKEAARYMGIEHLKALGENESFDCMYGAPTLIIVSGNEQIPIPLDADCAAALENMLIAAESLALGTCWIFFVLMAFQSSQGAQLLKELGIPENYKPYYSAAMGYGKEAAPPAEERKANLINYVR